MTQMLLLISILNIVVAILGGRILFRVTRNYVIWFFEFVFVLFFAARPLLNGYFGVPDPGLLAFNIDLGAMVTYTLCGLVFAAVFHPMVYWLYGRRQLFSDRFFSLCNFDNVSKTRFVNVFIGFIVLTYVLNAFKFHSLGYIFVNQDSFEAGMKLAGGLYFIQIMSSAIVFPCLVLVAKFLEGKPGRLAGVLVVTMVGFIAIVHPSDRTGIIAVLVAVVIYKLSMARHFRLLFVATISIGAALLVAVLLLSLNYLRTGGAGGAVEEAEGSTLLPVAGGVWYATVPAPNGMILIDYLRHNDWLYFHYDLLSMLPTTVIPSAVFPYKPRIDMEAILTYNIFGGELDTTEFHEGSTLSFTVPVAGYANLGYIGVIVAAFLYSIFFAAFLRGWKSTTVSVRFLTLYCLIFVVAGLRLSIEGLVVTSYWFLISLAGLYGASYFMSSPAVAGYDLVRDATPEKPATNAPLLLCASLVACIVCLIFYVLTS